MPPDHADVLDRLAAEQLPNELTDEPVTSPVEFARQARRAQAPLSVATSRSETPSAYADPDLVGRICADALAVMGVDDEDGLLNLCAPLPHLSGVAARTGAETLGTAIYNDHFEDYHRVIETGHHRELTVLCSTPSMAISKADEIREQYGDPADLFPALELGLLGGEIVRSSHRRRVREAWGIESTREYYGSSEASLVAAATDESRRLLPLCNHFILEIEVDGTIRDVREPTETVEGSILITNPDRDAVDLTRYRQGDRVRVHPGDDLPRIEPLGRADDAISIEGALIHPGDLYAVVDAVYPDDVDCVPHVRDAEPPTVLELYLVGADSPRRSEFREHLFDRVPAVGHAVGAASGERLQFRVVDSPSALPVTDAEELDSGDVIFESAVGDP